MQMTSLDNLIKELQKEVEPYLDRLVAGKLSAEDLDHLIKLEMKMIELEYLTIQKLYTKKLHEAI
jgi:hypothetical protein